MGRDAAVRLLSISRDPATRSQPLQGEVIQITVGAGRCV
jgi:hypothetical protein